jgi:hypothetical protein
MNKRNSPIPHTPEPEAVRRKLVAAYRKQAENPKLTEAERAEFLRMAEKWEATLPKKE